METVQWFFDPKLVISNWCLVADESSKYQNERRPKSLFYQKRPPINCSNWIDFRKFSQLKCPWKWLEMKISQCKDFIKTFYRHFYSTNSRDTFTWESSVRRVVHFEQKLRCMIILVDSCIHPCGFHHQYLLFWSIHFGVGEMVDSKCICALSVANSLCSVCICSRLTSCLVFTFLPSILSTLILWITDQFVHALTHPQT